MRCGETSGGGAFRTHRVFVAGTGRIESTTSKDALRWPVQALAYEWDLVGNLSERMESSVGKSLTEAFEYDTLNRLTKAEVTGEDVQTVRYDALGNITYKTGVGSYTYGAGTAGPHAVTMAGSHTYTYREGGRAGKEEGVGPS